MEEQETTKAVEVAQTTSPTLNLIEQAKQQADRMETQNKKYEELVRRQEEANAIAMLSGRTSAGQQIKGPEEIEKERNQQLADEITQAFR